MIILNWSNGVVFFRWKVGLYRQFSQNTCYTDENQKL